MLRPQPAPRNLAIGIGVIAAYFFMESGAQLKAREIGVFQIRKNTVKPVLLLISFLIKPELEGE